MTQVDGTSELMTRIRKAWLRFDGTGQLRETVLFDANRRTVSPH